MAKDQLMPPSPISELAAEAVQLHELKCAYVDAGFTNAEAMQIVCTIMSAVAIAAASRNGQTE